MSLKRAIEGLENAIAMAHDLGYYDPALDFRWKSLLWFLDSRRAVELRLYESEG